MMLKLVARFLGEDSGFDVTLTRMRGESASCLSIAKGSQRWS